MAAFIEQAAVVFGLVEKINNAKRVSACIKFM